MTQKIQTLALQRAYGVGGKKILAYIRKYGREKLFSDPQTCLKVDHYLEYKKYLSWAEEYAKKVLVQDTKMLCIWQNNYPHTLRTTENPPATFFYKTKLANFPNTQKYIAVVGTRKANDEGKRLVKQLISDLKGTGWGVISGMAFGIDYFAHQESLRHNIPTIAVIPSQVSVPTPASHTRLYKQILDEGGVIMSENLGLEPINKYDFPKRNRLIAGLAAVTLVVQAGESSGALITAEQAFSYARPVYTYPGGTRDSLFHGNHRLIKRNKAQLITETSEITELNLENRDRRQSDLDTEQITILDILRVSAMELGQLCAKVDKSTSHVLSLLLELEVANLIFFNKDINKYEVINAYE